MDRASEESRYFTRHLFKVGLECPTKLYYHLQQYPQNRQSLPFIRHAVFNKRLLKALARTAYPEGKFVSEDTVAESAAETLRKLEVLNTVLFDAAFEYEYMSARVPILIKNQDRLEVCRLESKAFDDQKHTFEGRHQPLSNKWKSYLFALAYQGWIIKQNVKQEELRFTLILPNKNGRAYTNDLPLQLKPYGERAVEGNILQANQELLVRCDVTELIHTIWEDPDIASEYFPRDTFEDSLLYLRDLYLSGEKEEPQVGLKCKRCEFRVEQKRVRDGVQSGFNECWRREIDADNPDGLHVFNLIGAGTGRRIQHKLYDQREIPADSLPTPEDIQRRKGRLTQKMRQILQIHQAHGNPVPKEIVRPDLFRELNRWEYPLHFLDFEAGNYAVPLRVNRKPYHLVVFQFSCHTLHTDGRRTHHQWINDFSGDYASFDLIRRLMKVPDITRGTIVQYSNFERNALKIIRRELMAEGDAIDDAGELLAWLEPIIHRGDSTQLHPPYLADLSRQVKHFYYNHCMQDSLSIKDVLQSVMALSPYLKKKYSRPYSSQNFDGITWWQPHSYHGARNPYSVLSEHGEVPVRRGTEAMVVYAKMISGGLTPEETKAYRKALLKYCELDTLAMVMIYEHWKELLQQQKM